MKYSNPSRRRFLPLLLSASLPAGWSGCSERDDDDSGGMTRLTFQEPHMGVPFTIRSAATPSQARALRSACARAFARIAELNAVFSDYLPESELNDLARAPAHEPVPVGPDLFRILEIARNLSEETAGVFDVTAGPLVRLWRIAKKNRRLPTEDQVARAKARTGHRLLALNPEARTVTKKSEGMLFDLGGIAKGYAADEALAILREAEFPRSLVAASGDIRVGSPPPGRDGWAIGLETLKEKSNPGQLPVVILADRAVSTSGDTRRFFVHDGTRYSHIVSPRTGLGLTERIAVSVIAPDATTSDSHATAVSLLGRKAGLQFIENQRDIECQIVSLQGGREVVVRSDGFPRFQQEIEEKAPVTAP